MLTPWLEIGAEIAAVTVACGRFSPTIALRILDLWSQILGWDAMFTAAQGPIRTGGVESIADADVKRVRDLMIELYVWIDFFDSPQNSAR